MHLYVEGAIVSLIETALAYPGNIDLGQLSFPVKIDLAIALDRISPESKPALLALNRVRNALAHHPEATVTLEQVQGLIDALDPVQRIIATGVARRRLRAESDISTVLLSLFTALLEQLVGWQEFAANPTEQRARYQKTIKESAERIKDYEG
jgi:hypothetical protein